MVVMTGHSRGHRPTAALNHPSREWFHLDGYERSVDTYLNAGWLPNPAVFFTGSHWLLMEPAGKSCITLLILLKKSSTALETIKPKP